MQRAPLREGVRRGGKVCDRIQVEERTRDVAGVQWSDRHAEHSISGPGLGGSHGIRRRVEETFWVGASRRHHFPSYERRKHSLSAVSLSINPLYRESLVYSLSLPGYAIFGLEPLSIWNPTNGTCHVLPGGTSLSAYLKTFDLLYTLLLCALNSLLRDGPQRRGFDAAASASARTQRPHFTWPRQRSSATIHDPRSDRARCSKRQSSAERRQQAAIQRTCPGILVQSSFRGPRPSMHCFHPRHHRGRDRSLFQRRSIRFEAPGGARHPMHRCSYHHIPTEAISSVCPDAR